MAGGHVNVIARTGRTVCPRAPATRRGCAVSLRADDFALSRAEFARAGLGNDGGAPAAALGMPGRNPPPRSAA